ncbi:MAG: non-ribosomal peptide synthetase [Planctomycetales bacterium]
MSSRPSLEERRRRLSPAQQALLGQRVAQGASGGAVHGIPRRPESTPAPLSSVQQRLWFLHQFEPLPEVYNRPSNLRLIGRLDAVALRESLREIVRRHETLRSHFPATGDSPMQEVAEALDFDVGTVDLRTAPDDAREGEARRRLNEENFRPFDLDAGPLVRACLLRLSDDEHWLALTFHHIVFDAWSEGVLWRELESLYAAFTQGRPSSLPELPIGYGDYAAWQQRWQQETLVQRDLSYWKEQLAKATSRLELATDFRRPAVMSYRGARRQFRLDGPMVEALRELTRQEGATLFMGLLAAFQVLLGRYTGQTDLSIGTPIAGRARPELEGLIGCFINTLVLRTDLSGDPTFRELLQRVRDLTLAAFAHQELPFEKLIEELKPERSLGRTPLFEAMLVLRNTPQSPLELPGLRATRLDYETRTAKFDLTLELQPDGAGLAGGLEYATDLFQPATIGRLVDSLHVLLAGIVAEPECPISQLPLLTAVERQQIVVEWNRTTTDYPRDRCIHELFEAQVARTPNAVAVVFSDESMTYCEINAQANQLAHHLIGLGVGPEVLVGLCAERSPEMIVGLLGILKAGGAYVPLDPSLPVARLALLLEDSQATLVVTSPTLAMQLPSHAARIVDLDSVAIRTGAANASNPPRRATAENLAYVLYTSGSTGRPKGVEICHRSVVNFLSAMGERPGLSRQDRLLAVTTYAFDISVLELFLPLAVGAQVVIASADAIGDGARLATILAESGATVMQATPATWQLLRLSGWEGDPRLKVLCGGESLPSDLANDLLPCIGCLWNMYGPTETTVWSTIQRIGSETPTTIIGRPIANTTVYVLDSRRQPVPVGVHGELYIGGDGLARGYLRQPELIAEKFVPDPFSKAPEARLYRTGDLVRWRADGSLEFLGRLDHQVKLRGFRIELGEIEAVLAQHPQVRQAVVVVREDHPGDKRLAAYIVPKSVEMPPTVTELRNYLHEKLPDYMVPAAYVNLDALPLTPNGKVDRKALPAPETRRDQLVEHDENDTPQTAMQCLLARIWKDVLHVEEVRLYDNFFDLGGSSLALVRAIAQIEKELGIKLRVAEVMMQTLAQLAALIERKTESPGVSG